MQKKTAIDLYSGVGGWTLGIHLADIEVLKSFEWWTAANDTHGKNFGHKISESNIREITPANLPKPGEVDFIVGSPPCTQFSYANRGGNGDLADGLVDIRKMLEIVRYLKPKYWMMENVPRVSAILDREISPGGTLEEFADLITVNEVFDLAEYGLPQSRRRMVAGNYPLHILKSYKSCLPTRTLRDVIEALNEPNPRDPNYGYVIPLSQLTDHVKEPNLNDEECRMNRESKTYHPVYNRMSFPDSISRPARTVTATCTRVSRESIVIADALTEGVRRLTLREKATLQGFPITYQFYAKAYTDRQKMVGNAIPPLFSYLLGNCLQEIPREELTLPENLGNRHISKTGLSQSLEPDAKASKYANKRSFRAAIPGLRYGSGVRFELKNAIQGERTTWKLAFYYGTSKKIRDGNIEVRRLAQIVSDYGLSDLFQEVALSCKELIQKLDTKTVEGLQPAWSHQVKGYGPYDLADDVGLLCQSAHGIAMMHDPLLLEICARAMYPDMNAQKSQDSLIQMLAAGITSALINEALEGRSVEPKLTAQRNLVADTLPFSTHGVL